MQAVRCGAVRYVRCDTVCDAMARTADTAPMSLAIRAQQADEPPAVSGDVHESYSYRDSNMSMCPMIMCPRLTCRLVTVQSYIL